MITLSRFIGCSGTLALLLTAACQAPGTSSPGNVVAGTPELPSEAPLAVDTPGDSPGKTSPPIGIRYRILGEPRVGQPLEILITSQAPVVVGGLGVQVRGDERVFVAPASSSFTVGQMLADDPVARTVTVTPLVEGLLYVNVLVQGEIDGQVQANNVTIPIRVGATPISPEPTGTLSIDQAGEAIISLPAQEN